MKGNNQIKKKINLEKIRTNTNKLQTDYTNVKRTNLETQPAICIADRIVMRAAGFVILAANCIVQFTTAPGKTKAQDTPRATTGGSFRTVCKQTALGWTWAW